VRQRLAGLKMRRRRSRSQVSRPLVASNVVRSASGASSRVRCSVMAGLREGLAFWIPFAEFAVRNAVSDSSGRNDHGSSRQQLGRELTIIPQLAVARRPNARSWSRRFMLWVTNFVNLEENTWTQEALVVEFGMVGWLA
jgi:hypothetical protein